jgi:hypothetical protein
LIGPLFRGEFFALDVGMLFVPRRDRGGALGLHLADGFQDAPGQLLRRELLHGGDAEVLRPAFFQGGLCFVEGPGEFFEFAFQSFLLLD